MVVFLDETLRQLFLIGVNNTWLFNLEDTAKGADQLWQ